jgi:hypothetical protein
VARGALGGLGGEHALFHHEGDDEVLVAIHGTSPGGSGRRSRAGR